MASNTKMIDINEIVKQWALQMFKMTRNKDQSKISVDDLMFTISWKRVKIIHKEPEYQDIDKPQEPKSNVLFKTTFRNHTDHEQEYSFKTERSTKSSCELEIERGVCYGQELGISLKLPNEVLEVGAGFSREVSVTNTVQESFEEELHWGVDSLVKVRPHHKTTAELTINEDQFHGTFNVKTKLSGKVLANITNRKDNNAFVKSIEGDISEIVKKEISDSGLQGINVDKHTVTYTTKGKCNMRYGIEQHVNLSEEQL